MTDWPSTKAHRVIRALERIGWVIVRQRGSHRWMMREGWPVLRFAWHDHVEIGPSMLAKLGKASGLTPEDL